jgi:hypothetical protein
MFMVGVLANVLLVGEIPDNCLSVPRACDYMITVNEVYRGNSACICNLEGRITRPIKSVYFAIPTP